MLQGPPLSTSQYGQFEIISITEDTADTYVYQLALPEDVCLGINTGQHVVIRFGINILYIIYIRMCVIMLSLFLSKFDVCVCVCVCVGDTFIHPKEGSSTSV